MVNIKRFVDRVSALENRPGKDLVIPSQEARALRDEIVKLLADRVEQRPAEDIVKIEISGGKF